jgi:hypothetical protein
VVLVPARLLVAVNKPWAAMLETIQSSFFIDWVCWVRRAELEYAPLGAAALCACNPASSLAFLLPRGCTGAIQEIFHAEEENFAHAVRLKA